MTETPPNPAEKFAAKLLSFTDPARLYRFRKRPGDDEIVYANFNDRVFSTILDMALCLFIFYRPLYHIAVIMFGPERAAQLYSLGAVTMTAQQQMAMVSAPGYLSAYTANSLMQIALLGSVFVVAWSYSSATPGKWLLRMRIVDEQTGKRPSTRQFVIRFIGSIIGSIPLTLGFLWIYFDKKHQGWHDKMAGTVVIKVKHWKITPADVSEYPEAVLQALAEAGETGEDPDYEIIDAPDDTPSETDKKDS